MTIFSCLGWRVLIFLSSCGTFFDQKEPTALKYCHQQEKYTKNTQSGKTYARICRFLARKSLVLGQEKGNFLMVTINGAEEYWSFSKLLYIFFKFVKQLPITPTIQYSNTPLLLQPNTLNFRVMKCRSLGVQWVQQCCGVVVMGCRDIWGQE